MNPPHPISKQQELLALAKQVRALEVAGRKAWQGKVIPSGSCWLDQHLPNGGYAAGTLVEWIAEDAGCGSSTLSLLTARQAIAEGKYLLVVDRERTFYPPAAVALGIRSEQMIVVHPQNNEDLQWAVDQGLRCTAVGAVLASFQELDDRVARRLQLAAEIGGGLGLFLHYGRKRWRNPTSTPSWADVQWHVTPLPTPPNQRCFDLRLARCRGGRAGLCWTLQLEGTELTPLAAPLHARNSHVHSSTLCLAAELALSADAPARTEIRQPTVRSASA